ncbi:IPT/TIG domain-containing protein [Chitinophaga sp. 22321]|uniref:IPT/TIG domain-containing protein n=1 Tax=Chitinophaga hostae TaxID=2831022 RepID=A0ABS5IX41_9BACT|nr:IPT/TIG domain-containing protein [Chitinophaga hostae]MBS0027544.1 IPT/TIG domain-containing protein [Chitinophaga hostae]
MKKYLPLLAAFFILAAACRKDKHNDADAAVNVKTFWPNSGNAGTIVTLQGQGLGKNVTVTFNGTEGRVVDARDSVLIVLAPEQGSTGPLTVKAGARKVDLGTYTYQALSLHGVSPANGPAGTNIRISGAGFSSLDGPAVVTVNGKAAVITGASDTLLVAAVPEAAGTGKITVKVNEKEVTGPDFTFQVISVIKPLKGGAGTQVAISGEGFNTVAAGNSVTFNGKPATVLSAAANKLLVTAPEGVATGPVAVSINGQKTIGNVFTVIPKPVISTLAPLSAPAGAEVNIAGDYFSTLTDEVSVTFNGKPATVSITADKQMTVKVPAGAGTGKMLVTVNGQQTDGPLFKEQSLGVSRLLPDNGLAGTAIIIKGMGFSANAGDNIVTFNGIAVPVTAATDTTLQVTAPIGVTTGALKVKVGTLDATGPVFKRAGVMTIAGGPDAGDFSNPSGVAVDTKGNMFVTDMNVVKKVTPGGTVTLFAGKADGSAGNANGAGTDAAFSYVTGLTIDAQDNLYVVDLFNKMIRKVTPAGVVTTYARLAFAPYGIGIDKQGNIFVGAQYGGVMKVDAAGNASSIGNGYDTPGNNIAIDNAGSVFYTIEGDYPSVIKTVDRARLVYAGGQWGYNDGSLRSAGFAGMTGIVYDAAINGFYVADNHAIRIIKDDQVIRITGWKGGAAPVAAYTDGTLQQAAFSMINGIFLDAEGNLYVVERGNKSVRKIFFK